MEVTGFVGPAELETRAQYLFERQGGFHRGFERRVFNGAWDDPVTSAGRCRRKCERDLPALGLRAR